MNKITRDSCVLSGFSDFEYLYTFQRFPMFMGATDQNPSLDKFTELKWVYSKGTGIIQLAEMPELSDLYIEQTTTNAIGEVWQEHHRAFAAFINQFSPAGILEIGGAHGILSVEYKKLAGEIKWRIIEPNPAPVPECTASFIASFFDSNTKVIENKDVVVHSHTMEHIYSPMEFLANIASQMIIGQLMIFSIPNLEQWFIKGHANALNLEHTYLLTFEVAQEMLIRNGFSILNVENFRNSHSIFIAAKFTGAECALKNSDFTISNEFPRIFRQNLEVKKNFASECNLRKIQDETNVYIFGAHVFSQQLLNLGLREDSIKGVLDNDQAKIGRRLYGTLLEIQSPKVLEEELSAIVILDAGEYSTEIEKQLMKLQTRVEVWKPDPPSLLGHFQNSWDS